MWREEEREPLAGDSRLISRQPASGQRNNQWKDPAFSGTHEPDGGPANGGGGRGGGRFAKDDPRSQVRLLQCLAPPSTVLVATGTPWQRDSEAVLRIVESAPSSDRLVHTASVHFPTSPESQLSKSTGSFSTREPRRSANAVVLRL